MVNPESVHYCVHFRSTHRVEVPVPEPGVAGRGVAVDGAGERDLLTGVAAHVVRPRREYRRIWK